MKPRRASISLTTRYSQYKKKMQFTPIIDESKKVLLSLAKVKVMSDDLSKFDTPI
jgi:hypothetical protein